ncbi:MAG TPA: hypothetical protein VGG74_22755 [Kofleriaceae bacterium]|jgi:hypothetical protein
MNRLLLASCLVAGLVNRAGAGPSHATQEAPLAKDAETIKLYCGNPQLAIVVDWPAFEKLDYQVLIAGEEGGDPTEPNRAADPAYVSATRAWILTGVRNHGDLPGAPLGVRAGIIVETFQQLCRDHAELRAAASTIKQIVLEPITDLKYLSNKDAIAFSRRTNDWSGVQNAMYETLRDDAENHRTYYLRWVLKGTTLTVSFNVLSRSGVAEDYVKLLMPLLDNSGGGDDPPAEIVNRRHAPPPPPPPPPPPSSDDTAAAAQCGRNDRRCAKGWGSAINCDSGKYAGLPWYQDDDEYARGALVYQQWMYPDKFVEVYRCTDVEVCHKGDGFKQSSWTQVGYCRSNP